MAVRPIPQGYHSVTPYLVLDGAESAIDFYRRAFGAEETLRLPMGDKIGHAEVRIGDSMVMLADEFPEMGILGPKSRGGPTSSLMIYTEDCDARFARAVPKARPRKSRRRTSSTATARAPCSSRSATAGRLPPPKEDLSEEETLRRMQEWSAAQAAEPQALSRKGGGRGEPQTLPIPDGEVKPCSSGWACRERRWSPGRRFR